MEYINRFYWLIALCLIISTGANASVNPKPFVIPELKEIVEGGRDYEVTVEFDKVGVKKMFASFAKLKKI